MADSLSASGGVPSYKITGDDQTDEKPQVSVQRSYSDDERGNPKLTAVVVTNDMFTNFKMEFDVATKNVRIPAHSAVPFLLLIEMGTRLSVELNKAGVPA